MTRDQRVPRLDPIWCQVLESHVSSFRLTSLRGAVFVRTLQLQHDLAGAVELEPFVGDGRAADRDVTLRNLNGSTWLTPLFFQLRLLSECLGASPARFRNGQRGSRAVRVY